MVVYLTNIYQQFISRQAIAREEMGCCTEMQARLTKLQAECQEWQDKYYHERDHRIKQEWLLETTLSQQGMK